MKGELPPHNSLDFRPWFLDIQGKVVTSQNVTR